MPPPAADAAAREARRMSHQIGATPRLRTSVVDKVLLEAISSGLKSTKKVMQTKTTTNTPIKNKTNNFQKIPFNLKREINDALKVTNLEARHESKNRQMITVELTPGNDLDLNKQQLYQSEQASECPAELLTAFNSQE